MTVILEDEVLRALRRRGIEVPEYAVLESPEEARDLDLDPPYVVKLLHPKVTHRAREGAIRTAVPSRRDVEEFSRTLLDRWPDGRIMVQRHVDTVGGVEAFLGIKRDPTFGPVILLGLGGGLVEELGAYIVRRPPLEPEELERALRRVPGGRSLLSELSAEDLCDVAHRALRAYREEGWTELDVNPMLLRDGEAVALDGLARG